MLSRPRALVRRRLLVWLGLEAVHGEVARGWRQRDSQPVQLLCRDDLTAQARAATVAIGSASERGVRAGLVARMHACNCCYC